MEKRKRISATGIGLILFLVGGYLLMTMFMDTNGSGRGEFNTYAGPVLPMTSLGGAEGVEVSRTVDFDFSPYETIETGKYSNLGKGGAKITDAYTLTNTNPEAVSTTLVYGFQGQFIDEPEEFPVITVDGEVIEPELKPTVDPDGKLWHAYSYEVYKEALAEEDFRAIALAEPEMPAIQMTAYHFTDLAYHGDTVAAYPMLKVDFRVDEETVVWTNRADVLSTDDGERFLMFLVERGEAWIFTVGGELLDIKCSGNRDHNINEKSAIDVEYELEVFETDFATVLTQFAENYNFWATEDWYPNAGGLTPEILVDSALKRIARENWLEHTDWYRVIEELFRETVTEHRMMYLLFPVELQPGQTVTVHASYIQDPSYDISGPREYREGYDMATKLGSDLDFTGLGASVSHYEAIEITEQNFGFDLSKGVTEVALSLSVERYYMEITLR